MDHTTLHTYTIISNAIPSLIHFTNISLLNTDGYLCLIMFYSKDTLLHTTRYFFLL